MAINVSGYRDEQGETYFVARRATRDNPNWFNPYVRGTFEHAEYAAGARSAMKDGTAKYLGCAL